VFAEEVGDFSPVITDDFILIPRPAKCDPKRAYRVKFGLMILVYE
jgi:hypothetical protein